MLKREERVYMKKTKKIIWTICIAIIMSMVSTGIVSSLLGNTVYAATRTRFNKTKVTLNVGKSTQISVKGSSKKVTWKSSNKKTATVTSKGIVTAKKEGKATITAIVSGRKYTCSVTVTDPKKSIRVNLNKLKNYISKYGSVNSENNKFIVTTKYYNGDTYNYGIIYEKNKHRLRFVYTSDREETKSSVIMYVRTDVTNNVSPEYLLAFKNYTIYCDAKVTFSASKYNGNNVTFKIKNIRGLSYADAQEFANVELQLALSGWNLLLSRTNLNLRDLGFKSYY